MTRTDDHDSTYHQLVEQETLIADAQELVCELLDKAGMSRQQLAGALGKSKGFVSQLLSGQRNMTLRTLADLAYATGHRVELNAVPMGVPRTYRQVRPALSWSVGAPIEAQDVYITMMRPLRDLGNKPRALLTPDLFAAPRRPTHTARRREYTRA